MSLAELHSSILSPKNPAHGQSLIQFVKLAADDPYMSHDLTMRLLSDCVYGTPELCEQYIAETGKVSYERKWSSEGVIEIKAAARAHGKMDSGNLFGGVSEEPGPAPVEKPKWSGFKKPLSPVELKLPAPEPSKVTYLGSGIEFEVSMEASAKGAAVEQLKETVKVVAKKGLVLIVVVAGAAAISTHLLNSDTLTDTLNAETEAMMYS
jgi:hypothetical protein